MQEVQKTEKRKDTRGRVLRTGESQRPDGSYQFRWSEGGERRTRYAPTLEALRQGGRDRPPAAAGPPFHRGQRHRGPAGGTPHAAAPQPAGAYPPQLPQYHRPPAAG